MSEIDPVQFGNLVGQVTALQAKVDSMETKIDDLLGMANRGKGALWLGMSLGGVLAGALGALAEAIFGHPSK
jgi:hypothetical protein